MTFNLHQGFDAGDVAALDRQADLLAHERPDVLIVQEVVRGWLIDEGHDVLGHLAARLGMDYVFAPNIGDLYGNAILSRYPITEVRRVHFAKEPGLRYQPRGAIVARVAGVLVIGTHLDENRDASAVRMEQVRDLLRAWDGARVALIACDCNALPEARELQLITDAGFGDLALQAGGGGPTFPADAPVERIDYLFGIGLTPAQAHPVASTASDHRAVVLNVTRSGP
jgi:endonuclease/exonuclease/phosphatase family metal-dependent hydrolase